MAKTNLRKEQLHCSFSGEIISFLSEEGMIAIIVLFALPLSFMEIQILE